MTHFPPFIRRLRNVAIILAIIIAAVVVLPLVIPIPPVFNTRPAAELADADSRFINVNGLDVHYKQFGSGKPVIILLHGFGASVFSWREVLAPLAKLGTVIAYDRPAFGLTQRPLPGEWQGENPYTPEANVKLLFGLMDALGIQDAILVGNSNGGGIALQAALTQPDRVKGLVLVDPAVYQGGGQRFGLLAPFINTPQMDHLGPFFARSIAGDQGTQFIQAAWHDPSKITDAINAGYRLPLQVDNWDIALWEFTKAGNDSVDITPRLSELTMPVLIVTGDDDRIVPTELSTRLAAEIPGSGLAVIPACGHVPHEECPIAFMDALRPFLSSIEK